MANKDGITKTTLDEILDFALLAYRMVSVGKEELELFRVGTFQ